VWSTESSTPEFNLYYEDLPSLSDDLVSTENIDEFQMISPVENNSLSITDDSCLISTRTGSKAEERPVLRTVTTANCSQPRYVLCETKGLIVHSFDQGCFRKPLTMDLPALISTKLTYELCLTVCRGLDTSFAVIHINKCYCFNGYASEKFKLTVDLGLYQRGTCGDPCSGMLDAAVV
jgi:hypothetical protein